MGAYEVRTEQVKGGVHVYVLALSTGACLWWVPMRWPPTAEGKRELADCRRHVDMAPQSLEREIRRQMR